MNADVHLQDTKKCLDRPLRFGNTSVQRHERLEIKMYGLFSALNILYQ